MLSCCFASKQIDFVSRDVEPEAGTRTAQNNSLMSECDGMLIKSCATSS